MYTISQLRKHISKPVIGDVWLNIKTYEKLVVIDNESIDSSWREDVINNYHVVFLVGENYQIPVEGEYYQNSNGESITVLRISGNKISVKMITDDEFLGEEEFEKTFSHFEFFQIVKYSSYSLRKKKEKEI